MKTFEGLTFLSRFHRNGNSVPSAGGKPSLVERQRSVRTRLSLSLGQCTHVFSCFFFFLAFLTRSLGVYTCGVLLLLPLLSLLLIIRSSAVDFVLILFCSSLSLSDNETDTLQQLSVFERTLALFVCVASVACI